MRNIKYKAIYIIILIYLIISFFSSNFIDNKIYTLIINPIFWITISIYLYRYSNNNYGRFKELRENCKTLFIITLFYIIIYFFGGLIFTYAKNPYSHELLTIIKNIYQIVLVLICMEYARSALINGNKNNSVMIFITTLLFILFEMNLPNVSSNFSNKEATFKYLSNTLLPLISSNILFSYLALKGSYKLVLTYKLPVELFFLFVPILPNYDWFIEGMIGLLLPAVIYIVLKYFINYRNERSNKRGRKRKSLYSNIPFLIFILIFSLFVVGVFSYKPMAILSDSMNPVFYKGDVVIYRKVNDNELKNLDLYTIIIYNKDGQAIIHRIVDKYNKNDNVYYITKGDNNNSNDILPVSENQVIGIYQSRIKYVGYPSVWLNEFFKKEKAKVETGE